MEYSVTLLPCMQGPEPAGFKTSDVYSAITFIWDKERSQFTLESLNYWVPYSTVDYIGTINSH